MDHPIHSWLMKPHLDIDVTDPKKLARARAELSRLLEIVEFALGKYSHARNGESDLPMPIQHEGHNQNGAEEKPNIREVIARLPIKFTTSDVIVGLGNEGKENRPRVKM